MNMDQVSFELILSNIKVENDFDEHEPPKLATIPCKLCNRTFIKLSGLDSHYKAHARKSRKRKREEASVVVVPVQRPRVDQQHRCQICDQVLSSKQSLHRHIQSHRKGTLGKTGWKPKTASKGPSFPCHHCGKICWRKQHLASHIRTQHPAYQRYKGQDYKCLECGKVCWNKQRLARHSRTEHPLSTPATLRRAAQTSVNKTRVKKVVNRQRKRGKGIQKHYPCLFCGKILTSTSHLQDHMVVHTREKPFQCKICKHSFSWKHKLEKHFRRHSEKDFKCTRCELRFVTKISLKLHAQTEHGTVQESATIGVVPKERNSNTPVISNKSKVHICSFCDKQFSCRSHLEEHMVCHTKEKPFQCTICEASYAFRRSFQRHCQTHRPENKKIERRECETRFPDKEALEVHLKPLKVEEPLKNHACTVCESVFATTARLEQHTKTHEATICFHCNKQCVSNAKLMSHMTSHTSENIFQCPTCKAVVESRVCLTRHMKYHTSIGHHKCQECQLSFLFRMQLMQHRLKNHPRLGISESESEPSKSNQHKMSQQLIPESMNPLQSSSIGFPDLLSRVSLPKLQLKEVKSEVPNKNACQYCGKVFRRKYDVNRHELIHTRQIPLLECKYCDKQFDRSSHLNNHLNLFHEEEKKFQCTKCDEKVAFSQIDSHMKGHDDANITNNNPRRKPKAKRKETVDLKCRICGKRMSCSKTLKMHYKRHDGDTPFKCDMVGCSKSYVDSYLLKRHQRSFHAVAAGQEKLDSTPKDGVVVPRSGNSEHRIRRGRTGRRHVEKFQCEQCDKAYIIKSQLVKHQQLHQAAPTENCGDLRHPSGVASSVVIKYACEVCNDLFSSTDQLRKHKETHENKPGPEYQYQCMVCVTRFRSHGELIAHQRIHIRSVEVPVAVTTLFICAICNKGFRTKTNLKSHNRDVHPRPTIGKTHECETCGLSLKHPGTLNRHRLSHGPKQFKCSICPKKYARKDALREHMNRKHSMSKNFECLVCGKRFYSSAQRSEHQRVHKNSNSC